MVGAAVVRDVAVAAVLGLLVFPSPLEVLNRALRIVKRGTYKTTCIKKQNYPHSPTLTWKIVLTPGTPSPGLELVCVCPSCPSLHTNTGTLLKTTNLFAKTSFTVFSHVPRSPGKTDVGGGEGGGSSKGAGEHGDASFRERCFFQRQSRIRARLGVESPIKMLLCFLVESVLGTLRIDAPCFIPKDLTFCRTVNLFDALTSLERKERLAAWRSDSLCRMYCTFPEHKGIPDSPAAEMHFMSPSLLWRCMQRFPRGNK